MICSSLRQGSWKWWRNIYGTKWVEENNFHCCLFIDQIDSTKSLRVMPLKRFKIPWKCKFGEFPLRGGKKIEFRTRQRDSLDGIAFRDYGKLRKIIPLTIKAWNPRRPFEVAHNLSWWTLNFARGIFDGGSRVCMVWQSHMSKESY